MSLSLSVDSLPSGLSPDNPFMRLPTELSSRIFEYVSAGSRRYAASCRLVCRRFHTLCSPYLITTVVLANRLETLRQFVEVTNHPYFSKHVTHLLWDASWYELDTAPEYSSYQLAATLSSHITTTRDAEYIAACEADAALMHDLMGDLDRYPPGAPVDVQGRLLVDDLDWWPRVMQHPESAVSHADIFAAPFFDQSDVGDRNHMVGFHPGWKDYYRRWKNWKRLAGAPVAIFHLMRAFPKLPKVKHVSYTDWRALAREGESYNQLCNRLFGLTVTPRWDLMGGKELHQFLRVVSEAPWSLHSVSFGRHLFEVSHLDRPLDSLDRSRFDFQPGCGQHVPGMPLPSVLGARFPNSWHAILPNLRSLHLPKLTKEYGRRNDEAAVGEAREVLALTTPRLAELSLSGFCGSVKGPEHQYWAAAETLQIFRSLLLPLKFECLRSLSLRGLTFSLQDFGSFLLAHRSTLRILHVVDSYCAANYEPFLAMATNEWGPQLSLTGVEVFGLGFSDRYVSESGQPVSSLALSRGVFLRLQDSDSWCKASIERHNKCPKEHARWLGERLEVEAALLNGRGNAVSREAPWANNDDELVLWYALPNRRV